MEKQKNQNEQILIDTGHVKDITDGRCYRRANRDPDHFLE
jgi:hypothetical protein